METVPRLIRVAPDLRLPPSRLHFSVPSPSRTGERETAMDETIRMRYGRQGRSSSSSNEIHPPSQTGGQSFNDLPEQLLKREAGNNIEDGVAGADVVPPMDQREDDSIHRDSHEDDLQDVAVSSSGSYSPEKNSSDGMPIHGASVGASLPSVDELRHMKSPNGKSVQKTSMPSMTRSRIRCIAIGLVVFVILIWILVAAGKGQMNKPKADQIVDFLSKKGVSSWQDLTSDASSPHVQAVQWLDLEVPSVEHELTHSDLHERFIARYILALIYFALSGPTWWNDLGFLTNKDICEWKGLVYSEKDKTSSMQGVVCDGESRLVELNLRTFERHCFATNSCAVVTNACYSMVRVVKQMETT
jgi:hypothetical protein